MIDQQSESHEEQRRRITGRRAGMPGEGFAEIRKHPETHEILEALDLLELLEATEKNETKKSARESDHS